MTSQEFMNISVGISALVLTGFLSYAAFNLSKTLKKFDTIADRLEGITKDVEEFKDFIKYGATHLKNIIVKKAADTFADTPKRKKLKK
jgi:hypothetical protein